MVLNSFKSRWLKAALRRRSIAEQLEQVEQVEQVEQAEEVEWVRVIEAGSIFKISV